jgi:glycosyltransferase involved in cell wall biosynthesis
MALRLPAPGAPPGHGPEAGPGPVVLFLPAHDEEATVAEVVARVPELVLGRRVECLVVDDGSADRTAELAAAAGATVLSEGANRGLGAAVRTGLAAAVERGAAAVAFCDADREYDPGELDRLVAPILEGRADYVVGSRFAGQIRRMLPRRRLGNLALTGLLRFVARAPIGDGQSGFRALSGAAAADAEIVHDYNYAQVLTLDLLAKGYRYLEVPIGYRFRTTGRSFVRPLRYLRRVLPAVWRELERHHRARGKLGGLPDLEMASRPLLEGAECRAASASRTSTAPSTAAWSASSTWSPATSTTPRTLLNGGRAPKSP